MKSYKNKRSEEYDKISMKGRNKKKNMKKMQKKHQ